MNTPSLRHLILPLNRPEYTNPEAFSTALAWSLFKVEMAAPMDPSLIVALQYRAKERKPSKKLEYRSTDPVPDRERLEAFALELKKQGVKAEHDQTDLARAVANSICGIQGKKGTYHAAASITESMALLQNTVGMYGKEGPPNLALIVEGLFGLGRPSESKSLVSAAVRWQGAMKYRAEIDPLARALDSAVKTSLLDSVPTPDQTGDADPAKDWLGMFPETPFTWTYRMWNKVTSEEWVSALPARVWVDWASTVLRMGLGMGFLWEAAWNEGIARRLLRGTDLTWGGIRKTAPAPLPWRSLSAATSVRDISSTLGRRVQRSELIRSHLNDWIKKNESEHLAVDSGLETMARDKSLLNDLEHDLQGFLPRSNSETWWEAIRYSLSVREESGPFADYYGLLRSRGRRYLMIDPGIEWIAVIASLSCDGPAKKTDLGNVMKSLSELGLTPQLSDIVVLLERAGLARGSADADQGVVIQSAF
jgi:hypothetical protein